MNIVFLYRTCHALLAIVTLYFIMHYLTPNEQGWYYTFLSFSALIYLFDFGLSIALVHVSAIEFVRLKWDSAGLISGSKSNKFQDFINASLVKYLKKGILYFAIIFPFGILYFNENESAKNYYWYLPWLLHATLSALSLICLPYLSIIEGSGNIREIYTVKTVQILVGSFLCCLLIYLNYPLFAPSMLSLSVVAITISWLIFFRKNNLPEKINLASNYTWQDDTKSFKNKVGITFLSSYLFVQIYTPILFYIEGPTAAGQFGLSLAIGNMIGLISSSWLITNIPSMTKFVAEGDDSQFRILFKKAFYQSSFFLMFSVILISFMYYLFIDQEIFNRILDFYNFIGILIFIIITHLINSVVIYIRCFKKEPLAIQHFICSILTLIIGTYSLLYYSVTGLIIGILVTQIFITAPVTIIGWRKYKLSK